MARGLGRFGAPWRGVGASDALPPPSRSPSSPSPAPPPPSTSSAGLRAFVSGSLRSGACPPHAGLPRPRGCSPPFSPHLLLSLGCSSQGSVPLRLRLSCPPPSPGPSPLPCSSRPPFPPPLLLPAPHPSPSCLLGKEAGPGARRPQPSARFSVPSAPGGFLLDHRLRAVVKGPWSLRVLRASPPTPSPRLTVSGGARGGVHLDVFPGHPPVEPDPSGTCC